MTDQQFPPDLQSAVDERMAERGRTAHQYNDAAAVEVLRKITFDEGRNTPIAVNLWKDGGCSAARAILAAIRDEKVPTIYHISQIPGCREFESRHEKDQKEIAALRARCEAAEELAKQWQDERDVWWNRFNNATAANGAEEKEHEALRVKLHDMLRMDSEDDDIPKAVGVLIANLEESCKREEAAIARAKKAERDDNGMVEIIATLRAVGINMGNMPEIQDPETAIEILAGQRDAAIAAKEKLERELLLVKECADIDAEKRHQAEARVAEIGARRQVECEERDAAIRNCEHAQGIAKVAQARVAELELDLAHERKVAVERVNIVTSREESYALVRTQRDAAQAEGADASEDGTGRGTPIVACCDVVGPLMSGCGPRAHGGSGLATNEGAEAGHIIAFPERMSGTACVRAENLSGALGSKNPTAFAQGPAVRRLTPRECERLQGWPDDHTLVPYRGKTMQDGPRYKIIGNGWALPCVQWIGRRIVKECDRQSHNVTDGVMP